jgi:hypothetical protein
VNVLVHPFEIVPFVFSFPLVGEVFGGGMIFVCYIQNCFLLLGMAEKIGADKTRVPTPLVARVGSGMHAGETAARLNISFKSILLVVIKE